MQKKKKNKLFIFLIICFVLMPFLFTKGCNYMESLNQAENSLSEPISSTSAYSHIHERAHNTQVHSIRKANWTGTAVPSSGYVEDVYFNTNLTTEAVVEICSNLTYINIGFSYPMNFVISDSNTTKVLMIQKLAENNYKIDYGNFSSFTPIFDSSEEGWFDFTNPQEFYETAVSSILFPTGNIEVQIGAENDKLSSLISITPFEQVSNELSIGNLFAQLANAILLFGVAVVELFLALEPIFWNNGPTLIFIFLIAGVAFALASWGLELLISLIGVFRKKRKKKK